jgi:hypothetical protein
MSQDNDRPVSNGRHDVRTLWLYIAHLVVVSQLLDARVDWQTLWNAPLTATLAERTTAFLQIGLVLGMLGALAVTDIRLLGWFRRTTGTEPGLPDSGQPDPVVSHGNRPLRIAQAGILMWVARLAMATRDRPRQTSVSIAWRIAAVGVLAACAVLVAVMTTGAETSRVTIAATLFVIAFVVSVGLLIHRATTLSRMVASLVRMDRTTSDSLRLVAEIRNASHRHGAAS